MTSKFWCFTLNNYSDEDEQTIAQWNVNYVIYGKEIGDSGTSHLQGYLELEKKCRLGGVKKLHERMHLEIRKGTQAEAIAYCKKDGNVVEFGVKSGGQGARTDLDRVRQVALEGGMKTVTAYHSMQQIRVAEKFLTYNEEPRDWKPEVIWLWGTTGTGKSRLARELVNIDDCYIKNDGTKWWDGYDNNEYVILDDFRDSWWSLTEMLSLLDRYEKRIEYKGGLRQFKPKVIIVTCAVAPDSCYLGTGERIEQLMRRIDEVKEMCRCS